MGGGANRHLLGVAEFRGRKILYENITQNNVIKILQRQGGERRGIEACSP